MNTSPRRLSTSRKIQSRDTGKPEIAAVLDRLIDVEHYAPHYQEERSKAGGGIFLTEPGLIGEVPVPVESALLFLAEQIGSYEKDLIRICLERWPSSRKKLADALVLAQTIVRRSDPKFFEQYAEPSPSTAELFARWCLTGEDASKFEAICELYHERRRQERAGSGIPTPSKEVAP